MADPIGGNCVTLLDMAKRLDANGKVDKIVEMLDQTNEILQDMLWLEGNMPTGHKTTMRTGLPEVAWRKLNYGVPQGKSHTTQVTDTCGMLEAYAEVDKELADLNGNTSAFRLSEDRAYLESMNQTMASTLFYGDTTPHPERFLGLTPRYPAPSTDENKSGYNMINGGGSGDDNTSIWLIVWGENTIHGIFPKGSKAGFSHQNLGEVTLFDEKNQKYQGYRSHYQWKAGLTVRDWKYIVRICNLDVSDLLTAGEDQDTSANLCNRMIDAMERIPNLSMGRPVFYANRVVTTALRKQLLNKSNVLLSQEDFTGGGGIVRRKLAFQGIPINRVDQLLKTETAVSFA